MKEIRGKRNKLELKRSPLVISELVYLDLRFQKCSI